MTSVPLMEWVFAPGVYATAVDEDLVILNIAADAYFCLPGAAGQARLSADRRRLSPAPDLAATLTAAGLIAPAGAGCAAFGRPWPPRATRTGLDPAYGPPRGRDLGEALRCLMDLAQHYRHKTLADILAAAAPPAPRHPPATAALLDAVRDFHRWSPYAPVSGKCLLRSFMLLRHLRRGGHDALWVFGVRTWPFHAHCWLQAEEVVLDDQPDRTAAFTPILVI